MKYDKFSRRMFLQGAGGVMVQIPFLSSLVTTKAYAANPIKRFISIVSGYDYGHHAAWFPNGEANFTNIPLPSQSFNSVAEGRVFRYQPLRDFAPTNSSPVSRLIGSGFAPHLGQINIIRSLDHLSNNVGHMPTCILGGISDGFNLPTIPTVDQVLNANKSFNPDSRPIMVMGFATGLSWAQSALGVNRATGYPSHYDSFYKIAFKRGLLPQNGAPSVPHPRKNVVDRVLSDYKRVRNHRNLANSDRLVLDNTADVLSQAQKGLDYISTSTCNYSQLPSNPPNVPWVGQYLDAQAGKAWADVLTAALICDQVRVVTLLTDFLSLLYGVEFEHDVSHHPLDPIKTSGKNGWEHMADRKVLVHNNFVVPLINNLANSIEPSNGKSMLFNSLILVSHETSQVHSNFSQPTLLIGNAAGAIQSGNFIDYADRSLGAVGEQEQFSATPGDARFHNNWFGLPYGRLHNTILQAMGLRPSEYERNEFNRHLENRSDIGPQNAGLKDIGGFGYALNNKDAAVYKNFIKNYDLRHFKKTLPIVMS